jgi:hypothetical protein
MGYRNSFDFTGQNQISGERAEDLFEQMALKNNLKIKKATQRQQLSHIDFILTNEKGQNFFLDIKARKKISRTSQDFSDDLVWIEFKNVAGNDGWLYGASDYIVFERENDFVIVSRKNLVLLCERIVSNIKVDKSKDCLYKRYSRKDRKDEISLIKMKDILDNIKVSIWQK